MTRGLVLLVLLSGCAVSLPASSDRSGPRTLAHVNADLSGQSATLILENGERIHARNVTVGPSEVGYRIWRGVDTLPTDEVVRIEVRDGRHTGRGAAIGLSLGVAAAGVAILASSSEDTSNSAPGNECQFLCLTSRQGALVVSPALIASAAGLGALFGVVVSNRVLFEAPVGRYVSASPSAMPTD